MQILRFGFPAAVIALAALTLAPLPARAQTVAVSFTPNAYGAEDYASDNSFGNAEPGYNLGYEFSVNSPITVTSVGFFYDPSFWGTAPDQGFSQDHPVGIYDLSGNLLDSATVSQNTADDTANGDFEYVSLAGGGLNLDAGQSYVIAGLTGPNDPYLFDVQDYTDPANPGDGLITPPEISYVQNYSAVSTSTSTLSDDAPSPSNDGYPGSYFGPNFQFVDNGAPVVPESSSLVLILPSLLVLFAFAAIRRRRSRHSE